MACVRAVRRTLYVDSVSLLQVSTALSARPGVLAAALVMGTELNREVLAEAGLLVGEAADAGPNDLVVAVRADGEAAADQALAAADAWLHGRQGTQAAGQPTSSLPRSLTSALRGRPDANLALISVPGPFAAAEARQALARGLHVFLFSDNVALQDEIDLKRRAAERGLLVMGPDCGTAILGGTGLGFANVVRRGRIGLIGASGTGLQEVSSLLHRAGDGISHAIGTGSRDLHVDVGAITTLQALDLLRQDPLTDRIVLVSKPPSPAVAERVLDAAAATGMPTVACLLGTLLPDRPGVQVAANLYQAARLAASPGAIWPTLAAGDLPRVRLRPDQVQVRGLYCGGTLCQEAQRAVGEADGPDAHQFVDFGDDRYTRGRAHPMLDPTLRNQAILEAGDDPRVAVVLLDVVLGLGAHPDPAGAVAPSIHAAIERAQAGGRQLAVFAHVVGTDQDPQGLERQEACLRAAGAHVFGSNYHAAVAASLLIEAGHPS